MDRGSRRDCGAGPLTSANFEHGCLTGPARPDRLENGSCSSGHGVRVLRQPPLYGQCTGRARRRGFENR